MRLSSGSQEALKWAAFGLMVVDHGAVALLEPGSGAWTAARLVGRLAWPLFAALIAYNVQVRGVPWARWWPWLLGVGFVAQPVMVALRGAPGMLNILFTILAGVVLIEAGRRAQSLLWWLLDSGRWGWRAPAFAAGAVAVVLLAPRLEYGLWGVLLVPAWALLFRWPGAISTLGLLVVLAGQNWGTVGVFPTLLAPALFALAVAVTLPPLRRWPRWASWGFYPAHALVLVLLSQVL